MHSLRKSTERQVLDIFWGAFHNLLSCVNCWLVVNSELNDKLYDTRFTTLVVW